MITNQSKCLFLSFVIPCLFGASNVVAATLKAAHDFPPSDMEKHGGWEAIRDTLPADSNVVAVGADDSVGKRDGTGIGGIITPPIVNVDVNKKIDGYDCKHPAMKQVCKEIEEKINNEINKPDPEPEKPERKWRKIAVSNVYGSVDIPREATLINLFGKIYPAFEETEINVKKFDYESDRRCGGRSIHLKCSVRVYDGMVEGCQKEKTTWIDRLEEDRDGGYTCYEVRNRVSIDSPLPREISWIN